MELFELKANIRENTGKGVARKLRMNECIPAVLYGPKTEPVSLSVASKMIETAFKQNDRSQVLVNLTVVDGQGTQVRQCPAIIKEVQVAPLSRQMLHTDFLEIDLTKKVRVMVPVEPVGKAKGVELGGMLQVIRRELEVLCMPLEIPESIQVDVSELNVGDSIHVEEITVDGIEIPAEVNFTVITLVAPKSGTVESEEGEEAEAAE
ncbi:50S ribosomal protein L25 [Desulfatiferula olefinivorans]